MKTILITLNPWLYGRLVEYAKENGISIRGAIRSIIHQFFKGKI